MSRIPDNENIRNDIYENLPCQAIYNESVRKIKTNEHNNSNSNSSGSSGIVLNNCNQNSCISGGGVGGVVGGAGSNKKTNVLPKELLYATPLRKSDRYKSGSGGGERNRNKINAETVGLEKCGNEKLYNVEYKLINKDNILLRNGSSSKGNHHHRTGDVLTGGGLSPSSISGSGGNSIGCGGGVGIDKILGGGGGGGGRSSISNSSDLVMKNCTQGNNLEERRILNFLKDTTQIQKKIEIGKDCPNASFSCLAREEHFANLVQQNFTTTVDSTSLNTNKNTVGCGGSGVGNTTIPPTSQQYDTTGTDFTDSGNGDSSDSRRIVVVPNENKNSRITTEEAAAKNLEVFMDKKQSPDKEVNGIVCSPATNYAAIRTNNVYINREWVLKKIALCLEQRISGKKNVPGIPNTSGAKGEISLKKEISGSSALLPRPSHHAAGGGVGGGGSYHGCLVLGSNGSGKTSICEAIMNGNTGTKGLLNRKLLACYFVNSQNPDCHSLSIFIRNIVLQILSHSSLIGKHQQDEPKETSITKDENECSNNIKSDDDKSKPNLLEYNDSIDDNNEEEEMLLNEEIKSEIDGDKEKQLNINHDGEEDNEIADKNKVGLSQKSSVTSPEKRPDRNKSPVKASSNSKPPTKPCSPPSSGTELEKDQKYSYAANSSSESNNDSNNMKSSPGKKSKIPIAITTRVQQQTKSSTSIDDIQQGGGEDIADLVGEELKNEIEAEINYDNDDEDDDEKIARTESQSDEVAAATGYSQTESIINDEEQRKNELKSSSIEMIKATPIISDNNNCNDTITTVTTTKSEQHGIPPPLPKPKSCRTIIADSYYEMLIGNPEIFECLNVDNIEKNPDECFKKALLFPLLELTPPRNALLLLIDSIDENYINEGNLISTLKGRSCTEKSRNIAELLSNHIHLFPKWLFVVCTTKKQTKHITKMFNGFKKITLDDLRKSHVVKDVQEYIINRLNTDFKGTINLTKEIIESLHQLYIKSNGCILYLEKVLDGIKDNFFSFREIKLIPCTLNGLYLYICQKSFNKKQYTKIRPILNVLLASTGYVDKLFLFNCLRTHNYTIDYDEFEKRLNLMKNILVYQDDGGRNISSSSSSSTMNKLKIFHNSFSDWLVDVKFATKKFICDVNEGHVLISMYYTLISDTLCANSVRRFVYHLIKSGEYLTSKNINLDLILMLLESRINLNDCFYTNYLNCCPACENEYKNDTKLLPRTRDMIGKFLSSELNEEFSTFLCDFFKPSLPTDARILKLLIETGINNIDSQTSCDSLNSLNSPVLSEKSQNIDFELADLLLSSEKNCHQDIQRPKSSSDRSDTRHLESQDENSSTLHQLSDTHRIEMHKGKALIHILASEGNHVLLSRALNACKGPIDLEIEDYNGQTALNIAARNGHLDVVKLLLNFTQPLNDGTGRMKHVNVNHADRDGWTPLRSASWGGHIEIVKLLISYPGCLIDLADKEGRTALRAAAWSGHEDILKILIEAGADVNSVDRQGRTSLIAASYMGHYDIVEILLENGADVNHLDLDGRSALCVAALCGSSGYGKVISTLLEHGANTDQLDHDGMSPLLVSSFEGNAEICELLLENGADPDLTDFMGRTPLWAACTAGHENVVKLLLFWGCGIDCMDSEGRTVLSIAAAQGNVETVRQLLDRGLDETHRDNAGWTPLHYAAFEGFHEVCIQLLESGAKIDECDNEGKTALHLAAQEGRQKCVQALLEIHSTFVDQKAHDGKTAFRLACLEGYIDCIQTLLKFGCDVNCKDADSRTTLYILALENKLEIVKYLLDVTDVDVNIPDSEGRTALHVSSWQGHTEMVKLLITMGNADVNAMDLECRTPLHSCAWQGNHEVMEILLYFGAIPDHACKQGATALGISAQEGHEKCVSILLKYGANPYKSDHCGRTPIKLAAKSNRSNIIKIFESYTKTDESNVEPKLSHHHPNILRSPEDISSALDRTTGQQQAAFLLTSHHSHPTTTNQTTNHLIPNNNNIPSGSSLLNASNSTHSSNFYENTMQSDSSSLQKRKSVISSQSTGSSNEAPLSFTQQLQRHTKLSSRNNPFIQNTPVISTKYHPTKHHQQKHAQLLPNLNEYQTNMATNVTTNEADMFDMECMSPLYATPPHSPSSELSSPGQMSSTHPFEEIGGNSIGGSGVGGGSNAAVNHHHHHHHHNQKTTTSSSTDHHFARDTHMRVILGNCNKESNHSSSGKSKRSGIATNPAMRMIRSRFDSAANLIRRTNNILNITSSSNQGSSSIGVKSGTFQWRKESQM